MLRRGQDGLRLGVRGGVWVVLLVGCVGCNRPGPVAVPAQVVQAAATEHAFAAADPAAAARIVSGIGPLEGGRFRWTNQTGAVRLRLARTRGIQLRARFWVAEEALRANGPVTVTCRVNGHELAPVRYDKAGEHEFAAAVDSAWLREGDNDVSLAVDRTYAVNGVPLGVALAELEFAD